MKHIVQFTNTKFLFSLYKFNYHTKSYSYEKHTEQKIKEKKGKLMFVIVLMELSKRKTNILSSL